MPKSRRPVRICCTVFFPRKKDDGGAVIDFATEKIEEVLAEGRLPILVGGTGLYLRSLLSGIAPIPEIPAEIREKVLARVKAEGPQKLHAELVGTDPDYAAKIHPNDTQRNARAAEVFLATGKNMTWWHTKVSIHLRRMTLSGSVCRSRLTSWSRIWPVASV